jgi:integrase
MPKQRNNQIVCEYFTWNLFDRDGVFYADGRMNIPSLGKHSLGTRDRDQALAALRELDRRIAIQNLKAQQRPTDSHQLVLIGDGWKRYLEHVGRPDVLGGAGALTQKRYRAVRDKHQAHCTKKEIESWNEIDKAHILAYGAHLSKIQKSDATVYLECTLLKQIIKWLIEEARALPESNRVRLSIRRSHQSDTYCYTREQIRAIVELCRATPKLHWLADITIMLATTGMRIGELAGLRWSDVDLQNGVITLHDNRHSGRHAKAAAIRTLKGRRGRRVPIHTQLRHVLENLIHRPDGRVCGMPNGGQLQPNGVCKIFIRDVIGPLKKRFPTPEGEIGFAHGRIHSFRHAFVSQAFLDGASEGEIREWVGHTNSRIVERYRHLSNEDARRKMDKIDFLGEGSAPGSTSPASTEMSVKTIAQL